MVKSEMRRPSRTMLLTLLGCALTAAVIAPTGSAAVTRWVSCKKAPYYLRVVGVSCKTGAAVARAAGNSRNHCTRGCRVRVDRLVWVCKTYPYPRGSKTSYTWEGSCTSGPSKKIAWREEP